MILDIVMIGGTYGTKYTDKNMKNVLILGSTGMLGTSVEKVIKKEKFYNVFSTSTKEDDKIKYDVLKDDLYKTFSSLPKIDYIVNCIGVIKPFVKNKEKETVYINSYFPYLLSEFSKKNGSKLIHITTDCVFSGKDGLYDENSTHDAEDFYGKSKSLGEPQDCMVIRTSIIGEEKYNKVSLIEWFKSMKGKEVNGFTNHYWNGVTTTQYANWIKEIIDRELYEEGLFHLYSNDVTKWDMLQIFNKKFNDNTTSINPIEANVKIDRRLRTTKELLDKLTTKSFQEMINEM